MAGRILERLELHCSHRRGSCPPLRQTASIHSLVHRLPKRPYSQHCSDDLSKKIAISRGKLDGYRREAGAALASEQDEQQARSRALALAQQRLTVATSRLNTMLRANDDARAGIEHARRDRQTRLAVLGRLRRELEGAKSRAKDTDVQAAEAADGLAKLRTEISTLQDLAAMETDKFEETLSTRVKTFGDTRAAASRKARMELIAGRVSGSPAADEAASPSADADAGGSKASPRQQQQAQASLLAMSHSQSTTGGGLGDNGKGGSSINAVQKGGMSAEEETELKHKGECDVRLDGGEVYLVLPVLIKRCCCFTFP